MRAPRTELARAMAWHFIAHLREELRKDDDVADFVTQEGKPFREVTQELIDNILRLFPDLAHAPPPAPRHLFRDWWERYKATFPESSGLREYGSATFNTVNQITFFKIINLVQPSREREERFERITRQRIETMIGKGRNLEYESVMRGELILLELWMEEARRQEDGGTWTEHLIRQLDYTMFVVYRVLGSMLKKSLDQTDAVLKQMLPPRIADELKTHGRVEPRKVDSATVMFCDIVGFTMIAESMPPEQLVSELDLCFRHFERAMALNHLEKIKTIGDSFMCAGGISEPDRLHAVDSVLGALRIQEFMRKHIKSRGRKGLPAWHIRIGMHSGPVVAGVLGAERFSFDIWGDTVNTANRVEAAGESDRVNISRETADLVRDFFVLEERGSIAVKNKGDLEMFFVRSIRPELCVDGAGRIPSRKFWSLYAKGRKTLANQD
jgi:class 3 adenylate cyclase